MDGPLEVLVPTAYGPTRMVRRIERPDGCQIAGLVGPGGQEVVVALTGGFRRRNP